MCISTALRVPINEMLTPEDDPDAIPLGRPILLFFYVSDGQTTAAADIAHLLKEENGCGQGPCGYFFLS